MNWIQRLRMAIRKKTPTLSGMPAGRYEVEYSIPAAGHAAVFGFELELTAEQATRFQKATQAAMIFGSGYHDPDHNETARELQDLLDATQPGYNHSVGVIYALLPPKDAP